MIDRSLWRFALVGCAATATHVAMATLALQVWQWSPAAANGLAYVVANVVSYLGNTWWSFGARPDAGNGVRYLGVSALACALTMALAAAVQRAGGSDALGIATVVLVVPALTYLAHRHVTYRGSGPR